MKMPSHSYPRTDAHQWLTGILLLLAIAALVAAGLWRARVPQPVAADAAPATFSSARALVHLSVISRDSHPTGTPAHIVVRDYLVAQLAGMGLDPEIHEGIGIRTHGKVGAAGNIRNIVARLPGHVPGPAILLAAHYDSAPHSPGAADNGASVAAVLETLRALRASAPLRNDVMVIFTDAEEAGLLGSESFVSEDTWAKQVGVVLNFEYRGNSGPMLLYETSSGNGKLIDIVKTLRHAVGNSLMYEVYKRMPNNTDLTQFRRGNMAGLNFGAIERPTHYHTVLDRVDLIDEGSVQHQGEIMLGLAHAFGNASLTSLVGQDSVYFDVAGIGMVSYPVAFTVPLSAFAMLLFVLAWWLQRRHRSMRSVRVGMAALVSLALALLLAGGAQLLWLGIAKLHPEYALMLMGDTYNSGWYLPAFCALACGIFVLVQLRLARYFTSAELGMGAALIWLLLLMPVSVLLPGASFLLLWPLLAMCGATIAGALLPPSMARDGRHPILHPFIALIGGAPGILIFAPLLRQFYIALTPQAVGVPVLLLALLLGILTPLLAWCATRRSVAFAFLGAAAVTMMLASLNAGFSTSSPRPNNLSYAQQGDHAYWLSSDRQLDVWTRQFFQEEVTGTAPALFGDSAVRRYIGTAPAQGLPPPGAEVLSDQVVDGARSVTLRIKSTRGAPNLTVAVEGVAVTQASFERRALVGMTQPWRLEVVGIADEGNLLRFAVAPGKPFKVRLTDTSYDLPLTVPQARPSNMMPQPFRDSDTTKVITVLSFE